MEKDVQEINKHFIAKTSFCLLLGPKLVIVTREN
jgi:hypothetical protein